MGLDQALSRKGIAGGVLRRCFERLSVRDDRRDVDDASGAGRHREIDHHCLQPCVSRLQSEAPLGVDCRWRPPPGARRAGTAGVVDVVRWRPGHGRDDQSGVGRSEGRHRLVRAVGSAGRDRRGDVRHRHRCLPHRDPQAIPARRRIRHEPVWLAHRFGRSRGRGAGGGGPVRLVDRLHDLRRLRAAGHAYRADHGRTSRGARW